MRSLFSFSLVIIFCFTFCKKKNETTDLSPVNSSTSTTPTTTISPSQTMTPSAGDDYCLLTTTYEYLDTGIISMGSIVIASFYTSPFPTNGNLTYGGNLKLNNVNIPYNSTQKFYYYSPNNLDIDIGAVLTWSTSGSGTITAFQQSFTPFYPKYTGGNLLPDTCIKSNGINLTINGITDNQDSVEIVVHDGTHTINKIIASNGIVSISSTELASFFINKRFYIQISTSNVFTAIHNGIKYGFGNGIRYNKTCYLK